MKINDLLKLKQNPTSENKTDFTLWNDTAHVYSEYETIKSLFEAQVQTIPLETAIVYNKTVLSYQQLNNLCNSFARKLTNQGIISQDRVCIYMDRSIGCIISILSVIKLGAIYVPLDKGAPLERNLLILDDIQAAAIITDEQSELELGQHQHLILKYDLDIEHLKDRIESNPDNNTMHADISYIIYTSGSTGIPKGVMIQNNSLVNRLEWMQDIFRLTKNDKVLNKTTLSFDVSVWEYLWPLLFGAKLHILPAGQQGDPWALSQYIQTNQINVMHFVPSMLKEFLACDQAVDCTSLCLVICSGEQLPLDLVDKFNQLFNCKLYNLYGPTEATIDVSYWSCVNDYHTQSRSAPIGKPIWNTQLHILNANNQTARPGEEGELYIGGVGVARGYWNRAELNQQRFIPDIFNKLPNSRLYKTGDIVRRLSDGNIEFLGRNDDQVKIRGYRIECGEIEAVIKQHNAIQDVVVIGRNGLSTNTILVAYVIAKATKTFDQQALQHFIASKLPAYMIPSYYVQLQFFPLNANGKLDRAKLPNPASANNPAIENLQKLSRDDIKLMRIWQKVLQRNDIGMNDDFFALGGHSLQATQIVSEIRKNFDTQYNLQQFFSNPTLNGISKDLSYSSNDQVLIPIKNNTSTKISSAQKRIWYMEHIAKEHCLYNIPMLLKVEGRFDISIFNLACIKFIERHESLRSQIRYESNEILQHVIPGRDFSCHLIEIDEQNEISKLVADQIKKPFDLESGILMRASVFKANAHEIFVLFIVHHIAADGWSMQILRQEILSIYSHLMFGTKSLPKPSETKYSDFAQWQQSALELQKYAKQITFWREKLIGLDNLELPYDNPRPKQITYAGKQFNFTSNIKLLSDLRIVAQNSGVSLYTALLAAFYMLMRFFSNQNDIILGTTVANRHYPQVENIIGCFINSITLRQSINSDESVYNFLQTVNKELIDIQTNQDLPFDMVVQEVVKNIPTDQHPLFQTMFLVDNFNFMKNENLAYEQHLAVTDVTGELVLNTTAKFDLSCFIDTSGDCLKFCFNYATALFELETIKSFASVYQNILQQIVAKDIKKLAIKDVNFFCNIKNNPAPRTQELNIVQLFNAISKENSNQIALKYKDLSLTYGKLEQESNQVANYLLSYYNIKSEDLVIVCTNHSINYFISILGILKAGAAYVPIDINMPSARIAAIILDSKAKIVIANSEVIDEIEERIQSSNVSVDIKLISMYKLQTAYANSTLSAPDTKITSNNLAYVIYTSGTTGTPKGVMVEHGSVVNYIQNIRECFKIDSQTIVDCSTNLGFDLTITTTLGALCCGATIAIYSGKLQSQKCYVQHLVDNKVNLIKHVPAYYEQIIDLLPQTAISTIILGGEKLTQNIIAATNTILDKCIKVFDEYGPTETTVGACFSQCKPDKKICFDQTYTNYELFILNSDLKPVPSGAIGELYIGGMGLARGYLNSPDLTSDKFIIYIDQNNKQHRLYKTGDKVKYIHDGSIEYIGRIDDQIKISGYRIEVGEIENLLCQHGDISAAIVIARTDMGQSHCLVAYIICPEFEPSHTELQQYLAQFLSEHLLPRHYVVLDQFPLSANHKVDRKALPAPILQNKTGDKLIPTNENEDKLLSIWQKILQYEQIGINSNFFNLGGHSLQAIRLITEIRKFFAYDLSLRQLFENPTIKQLAKVIANTDNSVKSIISSQQLRAPLSFAQQRLWFIQQIQDDSAAYNIPLAIKIYGKLNIDALKRAFAALIERHQILRTKIHMDRDFTPYQQVEPDFNFEIQIIDCSAAKIDAFIQNEAQTPFAILGEQLIRAKILSINHETFVLLITMHHLIADGWSIQVLLHDINKLYNQYILQSDLDLPELPIQYIDFAIWQRAWLSGDMLHKQLNYWCNYLQGAPEITEFPLDKPRPKVFSFHGEVWTSKVGSNLINKLRTISQSHNCTMFMLFITALNVLLNKYTRQTDLVVGSPISNRHYNNVENLIGFFINTLAIRTIIDENDSFTTLLTSTKQNVLNSYENQDTPFEQIVDELQIERNLSINPIYQTRFIYDEKPEFKLKLHNLNIEYLFSERLTSKFGILIAALDHDDGMQLRFEYAKDLYNISTVQKIADNFLHILNCMSSNMESKISAVGLLPSSSTINANKSVTGISSVTNVRCIHNVFALHAKRNPNQIAIIYNQEQITYAQVESRSNYLANMLLQHGITTGDIVGLYLPRSTDIIIAILAVLKCGAAYLPLDLNNPGIRNTNIINNAKPAVLLIADEKIKNISIPQLPIKDLQNSNADLNVRLSRNVNDSLATAYVIYTSGTTGQPKGVSITHANLISYLTGLCQRIDFINNYRFASPATIATDLGNTALFGSLFLGKTLVLIPEDILLNADRFAEYVDHNAIDCLKITPTHYKAIIESCTNPTLLSNLDLIFGGERLAWDFVRKLNAQRIYNHYGPTETTIGVIVNAIDINQPEISRYVPIGKPLTNIFAYILDENLNMVPDGVVGELYISGPCVAKGYLYDSELTATKFLENPFSDESDAKMYKTGDNARMLSDGSIEFIGRIDEQIKIRGFRIECGEIEHLLCEHGDVKEAVVALKTDASGIDSLNAYIIANEFTPSVQELQQYLSNKVPEYMIPVNYFFLTEFPMLLNGKLNRKALPTKTVDPVIDDNINFPATELEKQISDIWCNVLNNKNIDIDANFFQLGGDSIISIQVTSKAKRSGLHISAKDIFLYPTIRSLAKALESRAGKQVAIQSMQTFNNYTLSPMQIGLLFHSLYAPESHSYKVVDIFRLHNSISPFKLQSAWQALAAKHDILRTKFAYHDEQPLQMVDQDLQIELVMHDFSALNEQETDVAVQELAKSLRLSAIDLSVAPLFKLHYVTTNADENYFIWLRHHILTDGWSINILLNDLEKIILNENAVASQPNIYLPKYSSYIAWINAQPLEPAKEFWMNYLAQIDGPTILAEVLPTETQQQVDYGYFIELLSKQETEVLKGFARDQKTTLNTVIQLSWAILLNKYLQKNDFVFGVVVSGRTNDILNVEQIVGLTINTLPLRISLNDNSNLQNILQKLHSDMLLIQEHGHVSLTQIQKWIFNEQSQGLFDNIFVFENFAKQQSVSNESLIAHIRSYEQSEFFLTLTVSPEEETYFRFGFDRNKINEQYIQSVANNLLFIVRLMLQNVTVTLSEIQLPTNRSSEFLLQDLHHDRVEELFWQQTEATPNATAIYSNASNISYAELATKVRSYTNVIAHNIRSHEPIIAICLPRSIDYIACIFAALTLGIPYIPLTFNEPKQRIVKVLENSKADLLITNVGQRDLLQDVPVTKIYTDSDFIADLKPQTPVSYIKSDIAYVMYTSGTSGTPKGVVISHRSLLNYLLWAKNEYLDGTIKTVLAHSSFAFDMSITSIFVPLISGNSITIVDDELSPDNINIVISMLFNSHFIKLTPTHLRVFSQFLDEHDLTNLETKFIIGGEALPPKLLEYWQNNAPKAIFYNEYGPTEITVACSAYRAQAKNYDLVPIGKPINNTQMFVLDADFRQVPVGVSGEIYVSGLGLAQGYFGNSELTNSKFIQKTFNQNEICRLYRTGDKGRVLLDGNLQYLGRLDSQTKVRGHRVELSEIEAILKQHGDVKEAVVLSRSDIDGNNELIAFIIVDEFVPTTLEVRTYLLKHLPDYMLPAHMQIVNTLPLTSNGKLDSKSLLENYTFTRNGADNYQGPRNELEAKLQEIWQATLGVDKIGMNDNFFSLGGDSIVSIQLLVKCQKNSMYFSIKDLFANPTIAQLSCVVKTTRINDSEHSKTAVLNNISFDLTPIQKWFFAKPNNHNFFNQVCIFELNQRVNIEIMQHAITRVFQTHDVFKLRFVKNEDEWQQQYHNKLDLPRLEVINLSQSDLKTCKQQMREIAQQEQGKLDISNGNLFKAILFELSNSQQKLLIIIHHLIVDGVSWRILLEDLEDIYVGLINNNIDISTHNSDSFANWSYSLNNYAHSNIMRDELHYWHTIASTKTKGLPIDFNKGLNFASSTNFVTVELDVNKTKLLLRDACEHFNARTQDLILSALSLVVGYWLGDQQLYIDLEGHGRENIDPNVDVSRTIGWFTTIYPVLIKFNSTDTIAEIISNVQHTLKSIPQNGIGYGICKYLLQDRILTNSDTPEIVFNYLGQWDNSLNQQRLFNSADDDLGLSQDATNLNSHALNINCLIIDGRFKSTWKFSGNMFQATTILKLAEKFIQELSKIVSYAPKSTVNKTCLVTPFIPNKDQTNLFCVHPIDGDVHWYKDLASRLKPKYNFYALQNITISLTSSEIVYNAHDLAKMYVENIRMVQFKGPYTICGWSFGALIAFEIAKILEKQGEIVAKLFILDQFPIFQEVELNTLAHLQKANDLEFNRVRKESRDTFRSLLDSTTNPLNENYLQVINDHFELTKHGTAAYMLNMQILSSYRANSKVNNIKCVTSTVTKAKWLGKPNSWLDHCSTFSETILEGDHYSIFVSPTVEILAQEILND